MSTRQNPTADEIRDEITKLEASFRKAKEREDEESRRAKEAERAKEKERIEAEKRKKEKMRRLKESQHGEPSQTTTATAQPCTRCLEHNEICVRQNSDNITLACKLCNKKKQACSLVDGKRPQNMKRKQDATYQGTSASGSKAKKRARVELYSDEEDEDYTEENTHEQLLRGILLELVEIKDMLRATVSQRRS